MVLIEADNGKYPRTNILEPHHSPTNYLIVVLFAEELVKFLKRISMENGWWYRLPLNINMSTCETDCIVPSTGELFSLLDSAVRVIFAAVGL